jgi:hypothetical protein
MQKSAQKLALVPVSSSGHRALVADRTFHSLLEVPDGELAELRDDVILCRRARAWGWLSNHGSLIRSANPDHPNTCALAGYLAHWTDAGGKLEGVLTELLGRFPPAERDGLSLRSHVFLRFAEGVLKFTQRKPDTGDLDFVITISAEIPDGAELLLLAHFWKAETERRRGALDSATRHAKKSAEIALRLGFARLAARAQALEALLMLDSGPPRSAQLLQQGESVLRESEDWLWRGRVQAGFGQSAIEEGRYQAALEHFTNAKDLFVGGPVRTPDLGWAHCNIAHAQRLIASSLAANIDAQAELHRRSVQPASTEGSRSGSYYREHLEQVRSEAYSALAQSAAVFRSLNKTRAVNSVRLERCALLADCGDLEQASRQAHECFQTGARQKDGLLMAQARLLESRIEKTHCEEGVGLDLTHHAQRAYEYAKEALTLALQCEAKPSIKRRLLAGIYVCQGLLLTNELFGNIAAARECCHSASEYVNAAERDQLWEEYQMLAAKALHSGTIDANLRRWSEGLVEGKTFQQITEEFAELVIPAVWAREGKNISRVVSKLSISPKKVRRILTRVGLRSSPRLPSEE